MLNTLVRPLAFLMLFFVPLQSWAADRPISLDDLGFSKIETQSNPALQLQLEKRTSMLKVHQTLGLITAIPMIAQFFLASGIKHDVGQRNIHMGVGIATTALYGTTAAYAIFAPKPEGIEDKGNTKIHRILAWVHGPLMIITPVFGAVADDQLNRHERVHGIANLHGTAATLLVASYLASMAVMSFNF